MATMEPVSSDARPDAKRIVVTGLKRRSVIVMIVLTVVTFGFYYPIWFLRRRRGLNALDSPRKLSSWPFLLFLAFFIVAFIVGAISGSASQEEVIGAQASVLLDFSQLAVGVLVIVQCFFIKDILEDHLRGPEGGTPMPISMREANLSGLMTFLFTIFYLQHIINRDILSRLPEASSVADVK